MVLPEISENRMEARYQEAAKPLKSEFLLNTLKLREGRNNAGFLTSRSVSKHTPLGKLSAFHNSQSEFSILGSEMMINKTEKKSGKMLKQTSSLAFVRRGNAGGRSRWCWFPFTMRIAL